MTRILLPTDEDLDDDARATLSRRPAVAVYRAAAHAPSLLGPFMDMACALFEKLSLTDRMREMVILRVAMHHASSYEAHHHRDLAASAGVKASEIEGLLGPAPFTTSDPIETAAIRLVDDLIAAREDSSDAIDVIAARLGPRGATEVAMLIGFYRMVATFVEAIALESDARTSVQLRDEARLAAAGPAPYAIATARLR